MTEEELASRIGVSQQYLNAIACGRKNVTIEMLERIGEGVGMTIPISFVEAMRPNR